MREPDVNLPVGARASAAEASRPQRGDLRERGAMRPDPYDVARIISEVGKRDRQEMSMRHPQTPVENLRPRRKALGLTQGAIADRAGISRTTMSLIDRGMPVNLITARAVEIVLQEAEKG